MGNWLQLVGRLFGLFGATPVSFRHPYSGFAGLRYAVGLTMFVASAGMAIFLLESNWLAFFVLGTLASALGWLGAGLLLKRMNAYGALSNKKQKKTRRNAGPVGIATVIWLGGLLSTVGVAVSLIEGP
jgi:hypothetical protein